MIQLWGNAYLVDLPVERLRFDPDPLGLNGCNVPVRRCQAATGGLSPETMPAKAPDPTPGVTAFDVHGPGIVRDEPKDETLATTKVPLQWWLMTLVGGAAWRLAVLYRLFVDRLVLGRPRLRVVREDV